VLSWRRTQCGSRQLSSHAWCDVCVCWLAILKTPIIRMGWNSYHNPCCRRACYPSGLTSSVPQGRRYTADNHVQGSVASNALGTSQALIDIAQTLAIGISSSASMKHDRGPARISSCTRQLQRRNNTDDRCNMEYRTMYIPGVYGHCRWQVQTK
jgi:hypothetical protein